MPDLHLSPRLFDKLLRGDATAAEVRELVRHLAQSCPDCGRVARMEEGAGPEGSQESKTAIAPARPSTERFGGDGIFARVRARLEPALGVMLRGRAEAPGRLDELCRHPIERQRMLVRNNPRYTNLPLADLLLETAWERGLKEPAAAQELIGLALEILDQLDVSLFGAELLNDLRGRAWGYRANFLRVVSSVREAEEAFRTADAFLARGTGDLLESARVAALKSTLRRAQSRWSEASRLLDQALEMYLALDERHLAGRTMLSQALLFNEQGEPGRAIEVLRRAQEHLEPERDPYLARVVQQNLAVYLTELGRYEEAMALLPALRRRMAESGSGRLELLRLRWQEGKILLGLGHEARAEAAFLEVRKGFVEQGIAHDAAVVSLELASLYLRQGRTAEIRELTSQLVPIFQSRDLHQSALAALLLFQQAVEKDALTLRIVEEVAEAVRQTRGNPNPKLEDPS